MLRDVQKRVDEWVQQYRTPYWQPLEIFTHVTEELGEVAKELNHLYGPKRKKPTEDTADLGTEIADVLFALTCLANSLKIDLDAAFDRALAKYANRDANRYERKEP